MIGPVIEFNMLKLWTWTKFYLHISFTLPLLPGGCTMQEPCSKSQFKVEVPITYTLNTTVPFLIYNRYPIFFFRLTNTLWTQQHFKIFFKIIKNHNQNFSKSGPLIELGVSILHPTYVTKHSWMSQFLMVPHMPTAYIENSIVSLNIIIIVTPNRGVCQLCKGRICYTK